MHEQLADYLEMVNEVLVSIHTEGNRQFRCISVVILNNERLVLSARVDAIVFRRARSIFVIWFCVREGYGLVFISFVLRLGRARLDFSAFLFYMKVL